LRADTFLQDRSPADPPFFGMITTLSTKAGYLGEEIRDGFILAIDQEGGKRGGIPVELLVDDDGRKMGKAKQIADRFIKRDKVKILTGIVFSNVAIAVVPKVVRQGVIYVSANAGPSLLAGKVTKGDHENPAVPLSESQDPDRSQGGTAAPGAFAHGANDRRNLSDFFGCRRRHR
jgi:branched-chain amino acid transport system substrate-binding protein